MGNPNANAKISKSTAVKKMTHLRNELMRSRRSEEEGKKDLGARRASSGGGARARIAGFSLAQSSRAWVTSRRSQINSLGSQENDETINYQCRWRPR